MRIVFLGLSITSSWGNGHATTYRGLVRELAARGHEVLFLERDLPWYADNRDLRRVPGVEIALYRSLAGLRHRHARAVREADAVILGSYVPDGIEVGEWIVRQAEGITAFYDIDTPVTLAKLRRGECDYFSRELARRFDLYLSFTGGPILRTIEEDVGAPRARPLYCAVDPREYFPEPAPAKWDLGYIGTFSPDRQAALQALLLQAAGQWPAGRFIVAGAQYPETVDWPANVDHVEHLPPQRHREFYNRQAFTLNITRADMIAAGYSPSVRLFEAAACGTPIISDAWPGIETFLEPRKEILIAHTTDEMLRLLRETPRQRALGIGAAAREKVLAAHTAAHRARELESYLDEVDGSIPSVATREKRVLPVRSGRPQPGAASRPKKALA